MLTLIASMIWMPVRPGAFCPGPRFQSSMPARRSSSCYRVQAIANPLRAPYSRRSRLELWWYTLVDCGSFRRWQSTGDKRQMWYRRRVLVPHVNAVVSMYRKDARHRDCVPPIQFIGDSYISFTSPWISSFWPFSKQLSMAPIYIFLANIKMFGRRFTQHFFLIQEP